MGNTNENTDKIIQRVYINKGNKQKLVTIPRKCAIKDQDLVIIKKITEKDMDALHDKLLEE